MIRMKVHFGVLYNSLKENKKKNTRKRAGKYLHHEHLLKRFFKEWMSSTYPEVETILELKQKINIFQTSRKKQFLDFLQVQHSVKEKICSLRQLLTSYNKKYFFNSLSKKASYKYTQALATLEINKIFKKRGVKYCKLFI